MKHKLKINIPTARELEHKRLSNNWSWKQVYADYMGLGVENADTISERDADTLRKNVERKKDRLLPQENAERVLEPSELSSDKSISYTLEDDAVASATGTVHLDEGKDLVNDAKKLIERLFSEFNLNDAEYELVKYTPSYINGKFKVQAQFVRKQVDLYSEEAVVERYTKTLMQHPSIVMRPIMEMDIDNVMILNLADVHWNKLPYLGFSSEYLKEFEQALYDTLGEVLEASRKFPINRVALTLGHDFFQTNDHRGTTKKGTPVSHIMEYPDMFDSGLRILSNVIYMIAKYYVVDCYYILANHDQNAGWHASRELKLMYRDVPHVNVIVDKMPFHYVEWGNTLIELTHENMKSGRGYTNMPVTAREAWGRTKYHYSIGGHLHGEYTTKEARGVVVMGSRALSDTDEWHYLNGYIANIRGLQAYVFNKDKGHVMTLNGNL